MEVARVEEEMVVEVKAAVQTAVETAEAAKVEEVRGEDEELDVHELHLKAFEGMQGDHGARWLLVRHLPDAARSWTWFKRYEDTGKVTKAHFYGLRTGQERWCVAEAHAHRAGLVTAHTGPERPPLLTQCRTGQCLQCPVPTDRPALCASQVCYDHQWLAWAVVAAIGAGVRVRGDR